MESVSGLQLIDLVQMQIVANLSETKSNLMRQVTTGYLGPTLSDEFLLNQVGEEFEKLRKEMWDEWCAEHAAEWDETEGN